MFGIFGKRKDEDLLENIEALKRELKERNAVIENLKSRLNVAKLNSGTVESKLAGVRSTLAKQNVYVHRLYAKMMGWKAVAEHIDPEIKVNMKKYKNIFIPTMNSYLKDDEKEVHMDNSGGEAKND